MLFHLRPGRETRNLICFRHQWYSAVFMSVTAGKVRGKMGHVLKVEVAQGALSAFIRYLNL